MKYRIFGTKTGLVVSELVLGTGMFGTSLGYGAAADEVESIIKGYTEAGGNFIDTSDFYQLGDAERLIGDFISPNRHDFVIASKYGRGLSLGKVGNNRKVMIQAVEQSLKRLKTDYLDIYFAHFEDGITPLEEIVRGLDDLTRAGKIIYGGLSNFPAWRVATAATTANLKGLVPVTSIQVEYNLLQRATESELLSVADAFGLGVLGYSPLAGGLLTGKYRKNEEGRATHMPAGVPHAGKEKVILDALINISETLNVTPGQIAIAWVRAKGVFPVIGARTRSQLDDNIIAGGINLSDDEVKLLDEVSAIPLVYPHDINTRGIVSFNNRYDIEFPVQTVL
jgi:aryl-alcohol dehydrogenase-like predicted oxidoreductase